MREWLAQYKYRGNERYASLFTNMLVQTYHRMTREFHKVHQKRSVLWVPHLVTSVPVSEARLAERGFNQAEVLAQGLADAVSLPYAPLLFRSRHSGKQSLKTRMDRVRSLEGIFQFLPYAPEYLHNLYLNQEAADAAAPLRILLVDDIYTTGSTIHLCSDSLREAGQACRIPVEIYSLTWARS